jgi:hypothetical protein
MKLALITSMTLLLIGCSAQGGNGAAPGGLSCSTGAGTACTCPSGAPSQCGVTGTCECGAPPAGGADTIPCNVEQVLQAKCWTCHGVNNKFGAPTEVTASGFRLPSKKDPTKTVGALAAIRIQDPTQKMPPAGNPDVTPAEAAVIQAWANAGNPAGAACAPPPTGAGGAGAVGAGGNAALGSGGTGPIGGGGNTPIPGGGGTTPIPGGGGMQMGTGGTAMPGAGGTPMGTGGSGDPPPPPDSTCYKIVARNDTSNAPYAVPTTPDYYAAFNYALPWGNKKVQVVRTRSIIDNDSVLHHWLLYNTTGAVQDGQVGSSIGAHPDAVLIVGWAPGNEPATLPPDVGLGIPGQGFQLEAHYNNTKGAGQTDRSGVEVCVTEKLRAHEAQVSWLGTQSLNKTSASGTCKPSLSGPVTVLFSWPHEHLQGRHLKTVITRASGMQETLIDKPFDFNQQIVYATPATINPGDSLTTTCTYAQPTPFGQGTTSEMCYNFVTAYPGGALSNGTSFFRINDCTQ